MKHYKQIIILGTGGNCIDILDTINNINAISKRPKYECIGFLDDNKNNWGKEICNAKVLGPLDCAHDFPEAYFINGIGNESNFWKKDSIIAKTNVPLDRFEPIVHPTASLSEMSTIGFGTVILQNVTIAANVKIGNHVIVLPNAVVSHDDIIGDYTCIAGGVCVSGGVKIGKGCYLGTNSAIISNVTICDHCLVGMGSVVLHDLEKNSVVVGNPAKFLRNTKNE